LNTLSLLEEEEAAALEAQTLERVVGVLADTFHRQPLLMGFKIFL
jgi:hypothetical protein